MPRQAWVRLFQEVAAGRLQALEQLYDAAAQRLYGLALWRTASPEDAGDVVQQVFLRLAERRHQLVKVEDPKAWLLAVTHRAAVDVTRRRSVRTAQPIDECSFLVADQACPERTADGRRASALLATLPPAQRDVIYLRHFTGHTFSAIGDILGVSTFTAASRYRLGMRKLRRLMEGSP